VSHPRGNVSWLRLICSVSLLALSACNVTEVPPVSSQVASNECEGNQDCPGGSCSDGACVTGSSVLENVLLEVTPQPGDLLAPLPFLTTLATAPRADLVLQPPVTVIGYVTLHPDTDCIPEFLTEELGTFTKPVKDTIPVNATFTASARAHGLPAPIYESKELPVAERDADGRLGFKIVVPPGEYDVYLQPPPTTPESNCKIPPWLLLRQRIDTSGPFEIKLSKPFALRVPVHWSTATLDNFTVELLDSVSGRVLSTTATLGAPGVDSDGRAFYTADLAYSQVLERNSMNELVVSEASYGLVRVSPPDGTVAPTIMGDASAIGLTPSNEGGLLLSAALPPPVVVEAQTGQVGTTTPIPAIVTVTATRLEGMDQGLYASFVRTYEVADKDKVNADGHVVTRAGTFTATLPPGDYVVDSIPKLSTLPCGAGGCPVLAARRDFWDVGVSPQLQAGKLIQFQRAPTVRGRAVSTSGKPITGAAVRLLSSQIGSAPDAWNQTDREGNPVPFSTAGVVDSRGAFELNADPGTFHLLVQADPTTRFGWYLRPEFKVDVRDQELSVGTLTVPLARRHTGRVLVDSKATEDRPALANALIRAYVSITREGEYSASLAEGGGVVQVAETRTNDRGEFELLIPASLDSPTAPAD
jgi:hypothetical protein